MKRLSLLKKKIFFIVGLQIFVLCLSLVGLVHYVYQLREVKSSLESSIKYDLQEDLKGKTLEEILGSESLRIKAKQVFSEERGEPLLKKDYLEHLKVLENSLFLFLSFSVFSLFVILASGFFFKRLWKKVVQKEIYFLIEKALPMLSKIDSSKEWLIDALILVLDYNGFSNYTDIIKKYVSKMDKETKKAA